MRLTPSLLFILGGILPTAHAVEITDGLSIGGWGEATTNTEYRGADNIRHSGLSQGKSEFSADFLADADLKLLATADEFTFRLDLIVSDKPRFAEVGNAYLEQAFIDWTFAPETVFRAGRFQNSWLGWEGLHTPDLWRVNNSAAWFWNVQNHSLRANKPFVSDGVGLRLGVDSPVTAEFYVVNDVLGDTLETRPIDKAFGGAITLKQEGFGKAELGLAFDPRSVAAADGAASSAFAIDLNTDITAFIDEGWFFAAEGQFHRHPDLFVSNTLFGNDLVLLAMANYAFTPTISTTVMIDYVERGYSASDNEMIEYAVALLTRPRPQVRLNIEASYWDEKADRADSVGAAAVLLVALP